MARKHTTYKNPSIADQVANAPSLSVLSDMVEAIASLETEGKLEFASKTKKRIMKNYHARKKYLLDQSKLQELQSPRTQPDSVL